MDDRRFDALARASARASTRRAALVGVFAAWLPLVTKARPGGTDAPSAEACLAIGQRCGKGAGRNGKPCAKCCSRHSITQSNGKRRCACKPAGTVAGNAAQCCSGRRSAGGFCGACDPGLAECGSGCADLASDADNCGACGNACPSGAACAGGACLLPFGASCDANAACASGICACFTENCAGGAGACAAVYVEGACQIAGGGRADIYTPTPGGTPGICATDGGPAAHGACGGGMVYGLASFCFVPIDPAA